MFLFQQNSIILEGKNSTYKTIMKIGQGSEGQVFQAIDLQSNNKVAVKMLNFISQNEQMALKVLQEKGLFKNVINILDMNEKTEQQEKIIIVMDLADGCFYRYWAQNQQNYDETGKLKLLYQIAYGVYEIHSVNLIHRDLKPENIVYKKVEENSNEIVLKLCDTGLIRVNNKQELRKTLTLGSPLFMAPEIYNGNLYNEKIDIWSLGILFLEMVSKQLLFSEEMSLADLREKIQKISQNEINTQVEKLNSSDFVKDILKQMLVVDPNQRISTYKLVQQLEKYLNLEPTEERENQFDKQLEDYKKELQIQMSDEIKQKLKDKKRESEQIIQKFKEEIQKQQEELLYQQIKELELNQETTRQREKKLLEQRLLEKQESCRNDQQVLEQQNREFQELKQIERNNQILRLDEQHNEQVRQIESKFQFQVQQQMEDLKKQELQLEQQIRESYQQKFEEKIRLKEKIMDFQLKNKNELSRSRFFIEHQIEFLNGNQQYTLNKDQINFLEKQNLVLENLKNQIQNSLQLLDQIETDEQIDQLIKKKEMELKNIQPDKIESLISQQSNQFFDLKKQSEQLEKPKLIMMDSSPLPLQEIKDRYQILRLEQNLLEQDQQKFKVRDQFISLIEYMVSSCFVSGEIKNLLITQRNNVVDIEQLKLISLQQIQSKKDTLQNLNFELKQLDKILIFGQSESSDVKEQFEKCVRHIFQSEDQQQLDFFQSNFNNLTKAFQISKQNYLLSILEGQEQQLSKQVLKQKFFYISLDDFFKIECSDSPFIIKQLQIGVEEIMKQLEEMSKEMEYQRNEWGIQYNKLLKHDQIFYSQQCALKAQIKKVISNTILKIDLIQNKKKKLNDKDFVCKNQQEICKQFKEFQLFHSKIEKLLIEIQNLKQHNIFNTSYNQTLQILQFLEENEANMKTYGADYMLYQNEVRFQIQQLNNLIFQSQAIEIENSLQLMIIHQNTSQRIYQDLLKGFQLLRDSVLVVQKYDNCLILVEENQKEKFSQNIEKMENNFQKLSKAEKKLEKESFEDPQYHFNFLFRIHNYLQIQIKTINKVKINSVIKHGEDHKQIMRLLSPYTNTYEIFQIMSKTQEMIKNKIQIN